MKKLLASFLILAFTAFPGLTHAALSVNSITASTSPSFPVTVPTGLTNAMILLIGYSFDSNAANRAQDAAFDFGGVAATLGSGGTFSASGQGTQVTMYYMNGYSSNGVKTVQTHYHATPTYQYTVAYVLTGASSTNPGGTAGDSQISFSNPSQTLTAGQAGDWVIDNLIARGGFDTPLGTSTTDAQDNDGTAYSFSRHLVATAPGNVAASWSGTSDASQYTILIRQDGQPAAASSTANALFFLGN